MPGVVQRLGKTLVVVALIAVPIAAHVAVATGRGAEIAGPLVAVQAGLVAWFSAALAFPGRSARLRGVLAGMVGSLTLWLVLDAGSGLMLAAAVPHAIAYAGLFTLFAASLAPGHTPVITAIARRARGPLDTTLLAYTRRVTVMWCLFFASQVATSGLLYAFAPRLWWSVFVNLCTLPLVIAMFAAELTWRHLHHGIHAPAGSGGRLGQAMRVIGQMRTTHPGAPDTAHTAEP